MPTLTRRDLLKALGAAGASALAAGAPRAFADTPQHDKPTATADRVILLWMAGGMASTETFDPKLYTPFSPGVESKRVLSTFPAIPTSVDGLKISEGLENVAKVMDRATLIRTFQAASLGKILHSRHQFHFHTGYVPPIPIAAPHMGAWVAKALGPLNPDVPAFIDIGEPLKNTAAEADSVKAFLTSGCLGGEFMPFMVPYPSRATEQIRSRVSADRIETRIKRYHEMIAAGPLADQTSGYQQESLARSMENAYRLLQSPAAKALDLSLEDRAVYDTYNTGEFGLGCLLARRLVEAGARFIEVHVDYIPFGHWDTHDTGHDKADAMKKAIDRPIAQLVLDLEQRGLLDRTLIVLASEFSRDPLVEGKPNAEVPHQAATPPKMLTMKQYGMHAHFTSAGSVLMFGGGVKNGHVYGVTADEHPCTTIANPASMEDLHASIFHALGISPKYNVEIEKRPFYVTKDGKGKVIGDLFA